MSKTGQEPTRKELVITLAVVAGVLAVAQFLMM